MTEPGFDARWTSPEMRERLKRRHRAERRFQRAGLVAIFTAMAGLAVLLVAILIRGIPAFSATEVTLEIEFSQTHFESPAGASPEEVATVIR